MPKRNLKRKAPPEHKRYCRCTPFCGKKLTQQARRLHYKNLRPSQHDEMQDSETATGTESESDEILYSESGRESVTSINGSDDIEDVLLDKGDPQHHWMEYDEQELEEANPGPQDDMASEGEEELASDNNSDSEFDEWKDFDEANEAALSDEEKLREFEKILSAEEYAELWESRLYLILSRFCLSITWNY